VVKTLTVILSYRGYRIEVNAVAVDGRHNAEVRTLRLFSREKPHVETVTCFQLTARHAERAGEIWARTASCQPSRLGLWSNGRPPRKPRNLTGRSDNQQRASKIARCDWPSS
jgi:hypothetical protein